MTSKWEIEVARIIVTCLMYIISENVHISDSPLLFLIDL